MTVHYHEICQHGFVHTPCHCTDPTLIRRITCPPLMNDAHARAKENSHD